MAEFDLNFRDEINMTPAGSGMLFEHSEYDLNLRELDFVPAGSGMFFEHGEHNLELVVMGGAEPAPPPGPVVLSPLTPTAVEGGIPYRPRN